MPNWCPLPINRSSAVNSELFFKTKFNDFLLLKLFLMVPVEILVPLMIYLTVWLLHPFLCDYLCDPLFFFPSVFHLIFLIFSRVSCKPSPTIQVMQLHFCVWENERDQLSGVQWMNLTKGKPLLCSWHHCLARWVFFCVFTYLKCLKNSHDCDSAFP